MHIAADKGVYHRCGLCVKPFHQLELERGDGPAPLLGYLDLQYKPEFEKSVVDLD